MNIKRIFPRTSIALAISLLSLSLGALQGCINDQPNEEPSSNPDQTELEREIREMKTAFDAQPIPSDAVVKTKLAQAGITDFQFEGDHVILQDDMLIHKAEFGNMVLPDSSSPALAKTAQCWNQASQPVNKEIHYYISSEVNSNLKKALREAFGQWGSATQLFIREVIAPGLANMVISNGNFVAAPNQGDPYALADFPRTTWANQNGGGKREVYAGRTIRFNSIEVQRVAFNYKYLQALAVHEIGHTLGFAHTDRPFEFNDGIKGTPAKDPESVMNYKLGENAGKFSKWDLEAIKAKFPPSKNEHGIRN